MEHHSESVHWLYLTARGPVHREALRAPVLEKTGVKTPLLGMSLMCSRAAQKSVRRKQRQEVVGVIGEEIRKRSGPDQQIMVELYMCTVRNH